MLRRFISAHLHVSEDRTRIVNYAQWETQGALNGMLADPVFAGHIGQVAAIA